MKITKKWLENTGVGFTENEKNELIEIGNIYEILRKLINENKIKITCILITKSLNRMKNIKFSIFAAKIVLPVFEEKNYTDKRVRNAIEAVEAYANSPNRKNKKKTLDATLIAENVISTTFSIPEMYAAKAATYASYTVSYFLYSLNAVLYAFMALGEKQKEKRKILEYGISLIEKK